jgi:hypothetical protein
MQFASRLTQCLTIIWNSYVNNLLNLGLTDTFGVNRTIAKKLANCFGDGDGKLVPENINDKISSKVQLANHVISLSNLITAADMGLLSSAGNTLVKVIDDYYHGRQNDIIYE